MSTYWNRIFKLPAMAFCADFLKVTNTSDINPIFKVLKTFYNRAFPGFPQSCPVSPGKYHEINRTLMVPGHVQFPPNPFMQRLYLPNGRYKVLLTLANKDETSNVKFDFIVDIKNIVGADKMI
jgi:hypothetical protein